MFKAINIYASYDKREILHGVSIEIKEREIVALIGPNGAGKSTLLKVISGVLIPRSGNISLFDKDITFLPPHLRVKIGIGYFLQGGKVFPGLSVYDNLNLGGMYLSNRLLKERVEEVLKIFPVLREKFSVRAGLLSGGERQMLALGMVLVNKPKLLLIDEPSAGLAPLLVEKVIDQILEINYMYNISILLVEQNIKEALRISHRVYLMKEGHIIEEGKPQEKITERVIETAFFT